MLVYAKYVFEFDVSDLFEFCKYLRKRGCDFGIFDFTFQKFLDKDFVCGRYGNACALACVCRVYCDFKTRKSVVIGCGKEIEPSFARSRGATLSLPCSG